MRSSFIQPQNELLSLDGSVRILVLKQIKKLEHYPQSGELLGNKHGYDLANYRKLYVNKKSIRIIYTIIEDQVLVKTIAIGKRDDFKPIRMRMKELTDYEFSRPARMAGA